MKKSLLKLLVIFFIWIIIISCSSSNVSEIGSFSSDYEDWSLYGDSTTKIPYYDSEQGCIYGEDAGRDMTWFFSLPYRYLGEKLDYYEKHLMFDLKQLSVERQFDNIDIVILGSNGNSIFYDYDLDSVHNYPNTEWVSYKIPIMENSIWRFSGKLSNKNITYIESENGMDIGEVILESTIAKEEQIKNILSNIKNIYIRGEFKIGNDKSFLDNFYIK